MNNMDDDFSGLKKFLQGNAGIEWLRVADGRGFEGRSLLAQPMQDKGADQKSHADKIGHGQSSSLHLDEGGGVAVSKLVASTGMAGQMASASVASTQAGPSNQTLANMVGLSTLIYSDGGFFSDGTLPDIGSSVVVNGVSYTVIDKEDDSSGYQGLALYDQSSETITVVNRGSQGALDFGTDAEMAFTETSNQWAGAKSLADRTAAYATANGITTILTTGHSLGGTLTQMQAAYYGWTGYAFNPYGAYEVYNRLGLTINPSANVFNYRTMFDLVSDASTHIGDVPVTIQTARDLEVEGAFSSALGVITGIASTDLLAAILPDHFMANFYSQKSGGGLLADGSNNTFTLAAGFSLPPPNPRALSMAEDAIQGLGEMVHLLAEAAEQRPFDSGTLSAQRSAQEVLQLLNGSSGSGIQAVLPSSGDLLTNALKASSDYDAYRASLDALSPVLLQGASAGTFSYAGLWNPGSTSGLTAAYLDAKNRIVSAKINSASQGLQAGEAVQSATRNSYIYKDLKRSESINVDGNGGDTVDVTFGDDNGDLLSAAVGDKAELFGGFGDDTLLGGQSGSTLQGGAGNDEYIIDGGGVGVDYLLDTDGQGSIEWKFADGTTEALSGGVDLPGTSYWASPDGKVSYAEDLSADGSTELEITAGNKVVYVDDFTNGEFGITLSTAAVPAPGAANLPQLKDDGLIGDTAPGGGAKEVYEDSVEGALVDKIYGSSSSGSQFGNEILGDGNATFISAGDGENAVVLGFYGNRATTPVAMDLYATIEGGSGNQVLVGVGNGHETIKGGALGSDNSASTYIDGGGADALLVGGGQNSVIFGGTGADTLEASMGSGEGFSPTSTLIAGLSFWGNAYSSSVRSDGQIYETTVLPTITTNGSSTDAIQVELSLYQSDGTFAPAFNLLGSTYNSGVAGSDTLPGSLLIGGSGHDNLIGNSGNDTIVGGNPLSPVAGKVDDLLVGGAGADVIYGGGGTNVIYGDMSPGAVSGWADLDSGSGDTIYGGAGANIIYGSGGSDEIYGGGGDNVIHVGNGSSFVSSGSGNSSIYGGSGADTIIAEGSSNYIDIGSGNTLVSLDYGNSSVVSGSGSDTIEASSGVATITGGSGLQTILVDSTSGRIAVQSGPGGTLIKGGPGIDESTLVVRNENGDLVLSEPGFALDVTVNGYFAANTGLTLEFEDGITWGANQILQASITARSDGGEDTITGSAGNDAISAGYGNTLISDPSGSNTLTGGAGDDTIEGGSGSDTIEGGSGSSQILGGTGIETYVYSQGDGSDTIYENVTTAGADTLEFGAGITSSSLTYGYDDSTATLTIGFGALSSATITLAGFDISQTNKHQVTALSFADGTALTQLDVFQKAVSIKGTAGNDSLVGAADVNYFDGQGGNDTAVGGGGNDTFVFNSGYGHLEVDESYASGQTPVLQLGAGIVESALHVSSNGYSLSLTDGVSGDLITLDGMFSNASDGVAAVQLADGTSLTRSQLIQMEMIGTAGADLIIGTANADLIDGKGGGDSEQGRGGSDTFVFNAGYGHLEINESYTSDQAPVLQLGAGITTSVLRVTSDGINLVLTDGTSGDQVILDGMFWTTGDGVATVQLADGTSLTASQLIQMEMTGTAGADEIEGTAGADLIDGKGGGDLEDGRGGDDTFVFDAGYGQLEINETYTAGQLPVLQLGAGITASALRATSNSYNLILTDGVSGDLITLDAMLAVGGNGDGVAAVKLADGTTLTATQLIQLEMTGTAGADTIYGTSGADQIDGKGGNDVEYGEKGSDTFAFNSGYGHLEISESYSSGQQPVLLLGAGITSSTLRVIAQGASLVLTDGVSGDQITLDGMWSSSTQGVATVQFDDGTSLTAAQLFQMEMTGTSGIDTIYGTSGADHLDGRGGSDYVVGNGGSDTIAFNSGYGDLEINESFTSGQQPVLQLGAGIIASALQVSTDGTNLILTDGVSGDQIKLDGMWSSDSKGVSAVEFADGTSLTAAQLKQMGMAGTTGSDSILGTPDAELIDGEGGNDSVTGGGGNDTFVFNAGYGKLSIFELQALSGPSPNQAVLKLGPGISSTSLHVMEDDRRDLVLTDGVAGDQIVLQSPFKKGDQAATAWGANVQFSDGSTLDMSQLQQMASDLNGTTGSDYLVGTTGADTIDGRGGNDYELGNGGSDTYIYNQGYGALEIGEDYGYTLQLGAGITSSNLQVFESHSDNGGDMILTDGTSGDVIRLDEVYNDQFSNGVVRFSDGTTLTMYQLYSRAMYYYQGVETYREGMGSGNQLIAYSSEASHINVFYEDGITSADVTAQANPNGYLWLTNILTGSQIAIQDYFNGPQNVSVTFSDGVTWDGAKILQAMETGSTGSDTLSGTGNAEFFDGKGGKDSIIGNGGNDTFVFNSGYGELEIDEAYSSGQQPILQLGTGITASTLQATLDGANVVLTDGVSGDQITLDNQNSSGSDGVALVQFADGTALTAAQLIQLSKEVAGTTGDDTLTGTSGADWIDGKGGNDSIVGDGGGDTFVFNPGYGALEINEAYTSGDQPILRVGAGVTASALEVTSNGIDLVLTDGISGDQITLDNQASSADTGVALVQLADGTTLTAAQLDLLSKQIRGTSGADTLTGTSANDWFDGKGGSDYIVGNGGSDTFVFNSGYGALEINEAYSTGQQPVLQLGAGITSSTLQVAVVGANVVLTDGVSGDQITLDNQNSTGNEGVALVRFADGTTSTSAQLIQAAHEFIGTTGNDGITGNSGADLIDGSGGDDSVVGNGGNDTFVFDVGYGSLDINESFSSGQAPVLQLGAGITASNLVVTPNASGSGLVLTDGTSGDQITLENAAFDSTTYGVQEVQFYDGTTLTEDQLIQTETSLPGNGGSVSGGNGNDTLVADTANESLVGGTGNEVFYFKAGYGQDTLVANTSAQSNTILFGPGITASNLTFSTDGSELLITTSNSTGADGQPSSIVLPGHFVNGQPVSDVGELQFSDGSSLTMDQINQLFASSQPPTTVLTAGADNTLTSDNGTDLLKANSGDDTLNGGSGTDTLESGVGNTLMNGGTGSETYLFDAGFGQDTVVANGSATSNTISFGAGIAASDLSFSSDGSELVVTATNSTGADGQASSITLPGHFVSGQPVVDVSKFVFSDGSYLTMDQVNQLFGSSPPPSTTVLTAGADNTLTSDNGTDLLQANSGNDTLNGGSGTDTLESGVGNTLMNGGTGTETYLFNTGFGQDTVVADGGATSNTISFGAGITVSDLSFSSDGSELVITATNSTGADGQASSITLPGHFVSGQPVTDVGELTFSDGSYVTMDQINQLFASSPPPSQPPSTVLTAGADNTLTSDNGVDLLQANAGNDTLNGGSGTDTLESGVGNTLMNGGTGTETYLFDTGFGQDTVVADGAATSNTILFGAGITASDLSLSSDGSELDITVTNSTGADGSASSITLPGHFVNGQPVVDVGELLFNDGSYVTMDQINQLFASSSSQSAQASTTSSPMLASTSTQSAAASTAMPTSSTAQVNPLIHAMASFTGSGSSGDAPIVTTTPNTGDQMLHVAA